MEFANQVLQIAQNLQNIEIKRNGFNLQFSIYEKQGNYQKALELAQKNLALARENKWVIDERNALGKVSQIYTLLGDTTKAIDNANQALSIARQTKHPVSEQQALAQLGRIYLNQGEYDKTIELMQQVVKIADKKEYLLAKAMGTNILTKAYTRLGEYNKVIAVAEPEITLIIKINNREKETELLINLGNAYGFIGEYTKSKELIEQGLKIGRELKNPRLESIALNYLGSYYSSVKDYQKALELTQKSFKIAQKLKSPPLLISPQFSLGGIYSSLGDYQKSHDYYQQALTISQKLKNRHSEGIALLNLANNHFAQGKPQKTVELSQQALTIFQEIKVPQLQAFAHRMLSLGYGNSMNDANAMKSAEKFLEFSRKVENPVFEKTALNLLGMIHYQFGRNQEAIKSYQQALAIQTPENVTGSEWGLYAGLGRVYRKLNQPSIAIGYYKQAINGIEEIRRGIEGLPPELQNSFLDAVVDFQGTKTADIYRELAELLIAQGRQAEARQVLDLLKIQEIRDFAEGKTDTTTKPQVPLTDEEKEIQTKSESIIALSRQISECDRTNCKQRSQLNDRLTALLTQFNQDLKKINKEISDRISTDPNTFRPDSPKAVEIVKSQPGTVMIYPLVMEDKLWLLLYSGDAAKKFEVKVSREKLGTTVKQFRKLMEECETRAYCGTDHIAKIQPVSEKLYNWLIKPLEGELQQNKVKNLVFALDRVTRYVPMSALYDGKQYLIENYTIHNVLSADLTNTSARLPTKIQDTKVLAMGVSEAVGGFLALNNVPREVDNIVRSTKRDKGVYPGKEYLNQSFDYKTLRDNLIGKNILHLATHGKFVPGRKKSSYLLLGNGDKLVIPQIQTLAGLSNIHLVVLSACQTALANSHQDGVEIASLAYSFMNKGAKSVIASLWQVADNSTSTLMQNFYKNLAKNKQKITKAEAMRLAQLQLLYNKDVTVDDIKKVRGIDVEPTSPSSGKKSESKTFAHPYYWAPFVLIGNGL